MSDLLMGLASLLPRLSASRLNAGAGVDVGLLLAFSFRGGGPFDAIYLTLVLSLILSR